MFLDYEVVGKTVEIFDPMTGITELRCNSVELAKKYTQLVDGFNYEPICNQIESRESRLQKFESNMIHFVNTGKFPKSVTFNSRTLSYTIV